MVGQCVSLMMVAVCFNYMENGLPHQVCGLVRNDAKRELCFFLCFPVGLGRPTHNNAQGQAVRSMPPSASLRASAWQSVFPCTYRKKKTSCGKSCGLPHQVCGLVRNDAIEACMNCAYTPGGSADWFVMTLSKPV